MSGPTPLTFGTLLRMARERATDPKAGRNRLSQRRLAALVADHLGTVDSPSQQIVSYWEQGKHLPDPVERAVLIAMIGALVHAGGLTTVQLANELLTAGGYAALSSAELANLGLKSEVTDSQHAKFSPSLPLAGEARLLRPVFRQQPRLVGRGEVIATIRERLAQPGAQLSLWGLPGVGKSAVLQAIARAEAMTTLRAGVLYAELGPAPDLSGILRRWIEQCQGTVLPQDADNVEMLAARVQDLLGQRDVLVVLDDLWEESLPAASTLAGCCPEVGSLLLSSRSSAVLQQLPHGHESLQLSPLDGEQAFSLLHMLAPSIVAAEPTVARALAVELGLPLAINLAAILLREQLDRAPCATLLSEWRAKLRHLAGFQTRPGIAGESQLSLDAIIALSYERLEPEGRAELAALAAFGSVPNSWEEMAMKAVTGADSPGAFDRLKRLVSRTGLVELTVDKRLQTHAVIHAFLASRQPQEAPDAFVRHAHFYAAYVRRLAPLIDAGTNRTHLDELEVEYQQVQRALAYADQHAPPLLLALVTSLWRFWEIRGYRGEASSWLERALAVAIDPAAPEQVADRARLTRGAALFAFDRGENEEAERLATESLRLGLALSSDLLVGEAELLQGILRLRRKLADSEAVVGLLRSATARLRTAFEPRYGAVAQSYLGVALVKAGHVEAGLAEQRASIAALRSGGYLRDLGDVLDHLGMSLAHQDAEAAIAAYKESITVRRDIEDVTGIGLSLGGLAWSTFDAGRSEEARGYFLELLTYAYQVNDASAKGDALLGLGELSISSQSTWAAKLLGHVHHGIRTNTFQLEEDEDKFHDLLAIISTQIGDEAARQAWESGAAMATDVLVAEVLSM